MSINNLKSSLEPASVLILEDRPETLAWLTSIVNETFPEATITTAETQKQALTQIMIQRFDLALIDLGLPDGNGHNVIRKIRQQSTDTYIVVATIFNDDKHLVSALQAGANGYLLKDEDRETLKAHLMGIASARAPLSNKALDQVLEHISRSNGTGSIDDASSPRVTLTPREEEVLQLVAKGYNVTESAGLLGLTPNTVKSYLKSVYSKLGVSSRAEATAEAIKRRLIDV